MHPVYIKCNKRTYLVKYNLNIKDKISDSETASITEFGDSVQQVICPASGKPSRICLLCGCAREDELRGRSVTSARAPSGPVAPRRGPLSWLQPGSCSEPCLVSPLLLSPAPSSYKESRFKKRKNEKKKNKSLAVHWLSV